MESMRRALQKNKNLVNEFFTRLEAEPFPHDVLAEYYPDAVDLWTVSYTHLTLPTKRIV